MDNLFIPHTDTTINQSDLPMIEKEYKKAIKNKKKVFKVALSCGKTGEFVVGYAKYLIEFLTNLKNEQRKNN
jgi:hypothetical protein